MAIYHFTATMMSRSSRNTAQALAYRAGCCVKDPVSGKSFSYERKEVDHVVLCLPKDSPAWIREIKDLLATIPKEDRNETREDNGKDPKKETSKAIKREALQRFCTVVEGAEKRKDAQVYREIEFALPKELTVQQNINLAKDFLHNNICFEGIAALANFHFDIDPQTKELRPHCHALLLTRRLTPEGLSPHKELAWNQKSFLQNLREQFALTTNAHLKLNGIKGKIDHRSYKDRHIDIAPQPKLSRKIKEMEARLHGLSQGSPYEQPQTRKGQAFYGTTLRNLYTLIKRPEIIFDIITQHHSTFVWGDVKHALQPFVKHKALFERMEAKLKASPDLIFLSTQTMPNHQKGAGAFAEEAIYTTRSIVQREAFLEKTCREMCRIPPKTSFSFRVDPDFIKNIPPFLSDEQRRALEHIIHPRQLSCLVGLAGSGKSTVISQAAQLWQGCGITVYGIAPTGKAAHALTALGVPSQTLHRFLSQNTFRRESVVICDEASLLDTRQLHRFFHILKTYHMKGVLLGDSQQLQSIEAGATFRWLTASSPTASLTKVHRQKNSWQQEATALFGKGKTKGALFLYHNKGRLHLIPGTQGDARQALLKDWAHHSPATSLILATTLKEVDALNSGARFLMKEKGALAPRDTLIRTHILHRDDQGLPTLSIKPKGFTTGDKIVFLKNDSRLQVTNGSQGILESVSPSSFKVKMGERTLVFNPRIYPYIDHGWALTVHKSQGLTVPRTFFLTGSFNTQNLTYVAMSRHKEDVQVYGATEKWTHHTAWIKDLSTPQEKLMASDYIGAKDLIDLAKEHPPSLKKELGSFVHSISSTLEATGFIGKELFYKTAAPFLEDPREILTAQSFYRLSEGKRALYLNKKVSRQDAPSPMSPAHHKTPAQNQPTLPVLKDIPTKNLPSFDLSRIPKDTLIHAAASLWGSPSQSSTPSTLRFGRTGKIALAVEGPATGLWYNFAQGQGGNIVQALQQEQKLTFPEALKELVSDSALPAPPLSSSTLQGTKNQYLPQKIFKTSIPLKGTLGETYLRDHRGIDSPYVTPSADIRFLPGSSTHNPSLASFFRNKEGNITGVQLIALDPQTGNKALVEVPKRSLGTVKGSYVICQEGDATTPVFVAEGIETALSIKAAGVKGAILASGGIANMKNVPIEKGQSLIICADHDTAPTVVGFIEKTLAHHKNQGVVVHAIKPPTPETDFNDLLQEKGPLGVRDALKETLPSLTRQLLPFPKQHPHTDLMKEMTAHYDAYYRSGYQKQAGKIMEVSIHDPHGQLHTTMDSYLFTLGTDPSLNHLIDYETMAGQGVRWALTRMLDAPLPFYVLSLPTPEQCAKLTPQELMEEVREKHAFLTHRQDLIQKTDHLGVKDFQGTLHQEPSGYLVAIGSDPLVNTKLDYHSEIGQNIRQAMEGDLGRTLPFHGVAQIPEDPLRRQHLSELSPQQLHQEIHQTLAYLEAGWQKASFQKDLSFGATDYKGHFHNHTMDYLSALGDDQKVMERLDPQSDLRGRIGEAKDLHRALQLDFSKEKQLTL